MWRGSLSIALLGENTHDPCGDARLVLHRGCVYIDAAGEQGSACPPAGNPRCSWANEGSSAGSMPQRLPISPDALPLGLLHGAAPGAGLRAARLDEFFEALEIATYASG